MRTISAALTTTTARSPECTRALASCSLAASLQGDQRSAAGLAEQSGNVACELGDPAGIAMATHVAGLSAFFSDVFARGETLLLESARRYRDLEGVDGLSAALDVHLGLLGISQGRLTEAGERLTGTYDRCVRRGDRWFRAYTVDGLGFLALLDGRLDDARRLSGESLALAAEFDDAIGLSLGPSSFAFCGVSSLRSMNPGTAARATSLAPTDPR